MGLRLVSTRQSIPLIRVFSLSEQLFVPGVHRLSYFHTSLLLKRTVRWSDAPRDRVGYKGLIQQLRLEVIQTVSGSLLVWHEAGSKIAIFIALLGPAAKSRVEPGPG